MSKAPLPRPQLDADDPKRFRVDKVQVSRVLAFIEQQQGPTDVLPLPLSPTELQACEDPSSILANRLAVSERFAVTGFSFEKHSLKWDNHPQVPVHVRAYAYLSHLLHMDGNEVQLLLGPLNLNDLLSHQWDAVPSTGKGLLVSRLQRYLREGTAVCSL